VQKPLGRARVIPKSMPGGRPHVVGIELVIVKWCKGNVSYQ
jgi:hypothetical protein